MELPYRLNSLGMDLQDRAKKQAEDVLLAGRSMGVTQAAAEMRWDSHKQPLVFKHGNAKKNCHRAMAVARL